LRIDTGIPDGRIATISEPANVHNSQVEYESADDFVLASSTHVLNASFTGLLTGGATPSDVSNVVVEIYRVFPNDSDVSRTSGPPTFSTSQVPTRVNSPADVAFQTRNSANNELGFQATVLDAAFSAGNSVSSADKLALHSGGNGPVTGEEVRFDVKLIVPFDLPADHYFFIPQVGLSDEAPAGADFLWLSAPKVAVPPSPNKTPRSDLQSWMRDDPPLAPDWLRIGTDIAGGATFNASFSLFGTQSAETTASLNSLIAPQTNLPRLKDGFATGDGSGLLKDQSHVGSDADLVKDGTLAKGSTGQSDTGVAKLTGLHRSSNGKVAPIDQGIDGIGLLS
jgi:hypothetical protein